MLIRIIYFIVIIFANTIGAISGMGGGVIIRPILDAINYHDVVSISFYSSVAVLTMSTVSTIIKIKNGISIQPGLAVFTSLGSVFGGILGNLLFEALLNIFSSEVKVLGIQITISILTLIFSLLYTVKRWQSFQLTSRGAYFLIGGILGCVASLLGIGGGPLNVACFMLLFGMPIKDATIYSIITIFFSQLSRIVTIGLTTGYQIFDLNILVFIIPAAIIGGLLGAKLSNIFSEKIITKVYQIVIIGVIILNLINGINII